MKKIGTLMLVLLMAATSLSFAGNGNKNEDQSKIHWMTIEQAEQKMKEHPKMVLMDVYTSWCVWCKRLDKTTYNNPDLIKYVNENFYAVKFNAEQKTPIHFMGKEWDYNSQYQVNDLAIDLLHGRMSYPTTVIMEKDFKSAEPIPGYLEVPQMESILKYFGDDVYLHEKWADYQKSFKSTWATKNTQQ